MAEHQVSTLGMGVRSSPPASSDAIATLSVVKTDEQRRARELRALGWSIGEIEMEVGVSRASVSYWVREVPLSEEAQKRLLWRVGLGPLTSAQRSATRARTVRRAHQDDGRALARSRDGSYRAGCMLFWAEGDKRRNGAAIANSDPDLLVVFAAFLREHFDVTDDKIVISCNLFADHAVRQHEIEDVWLAKLGLPRSQLRKTIVNKYSKHSQKKRQNKLPFGTCKLVVHSTQIVQTIYGSIQEYGGFERPEWLD
jgi:hypothetical protein